jgi:hypothetical protein
MTSLARAQLPQHPLQQLAVTLQLARQLRLGQLRLDAAEPPLCGLALLAQRLRHAARKFVTAALPLAPVVGDLDRAQVVGHSLLRPAILALACETGIGVDPRLADAQRATRLLERALRGEHALLPVE